MFQLDLRLENDSFLIGELSLCQIRLMNCRDFPWLVLIPQRANLVEWIDLEREEQHQLSDEIAITSHILQALVTPYKINVAALGNQVRQLHVHVIGRYQSDAIWPKPVFGYDYALYEEEEARRQLYEFKTAFNSFGR